MRTRRPDDRVTGRVAIGTCFLAVAFVLICSSALAEDAKILRLGVFAPERHVHVAKVLKPWVDDVNLALADDGIEIRLFSGGALGRKGEHQRRLLVTGVLDLTWFPTGYIPGRYPAVDLLEIPLLTADPEALTQAFWRLYARGELPGFDDVKPLALSVSPPYHFHLTFDLDSLDDMAGRKIRVLNAAQAEMMMTLGATPVGGISATDVAQSLSRGLIDGVLFSWHATRSMGIELVTPSHINQPIAFSPSVLVMNRKSFAALPLRAQQAIEARSGESLSLAYTRSMLVEVERALARVSADPSHRFYTPTDEEQARFTTAFERLVQRWQQNDPERQRLLEALRRVLEEIDAEASGAAPHD